MLITVWVLASGGDLAPDGVVLAIYLARIRIARVSQHKYTHFGSCT